MSDTGPSYSDLRKAFSMISSEISMGDYGDEAHTLLNRLDEIMLADHPERPEVKIREMDDEELMKEASIANSIGRDDEMNAPWLDMLEEEIMDRGLVRDYV